MFRRYAVIKGNPRYKQDVHYNDSIQDAEDRARPMVAMNGDVVAIYELVAVVRRATPPIEVQTQFFGQQAAGVG